MMMLLTLTVVVMIVVIIELSVSTPPASRDAIGNSADLAIGSMNGLYSRSIEVRLSA